MKDPTIIIQMDTSKVANYTDLEFLILQLKEERSYQEEDLKYHFNILVDSFNPISILKTSIFKLTKEKALLVEVGKVGLIVGAHFLIDRVFGKYKSVRGLLSSILMENVATSLIDKNAANIISDIGNRIMHNNDQDQTNK